MTGYVIAGMWLRGSTPQEARDRSAGAKSFCNEPVRSAQLSWPGRRIASSLYQSPEPVQRGRCSWARACELTRVFLCAGSTRTSWRGTPTSFRSCCSDGSATRTGPSWATRPWPWASSTWPRWVLHTWLCDVKCSSAWVSVSLFPRMPLKLCLFKKRHEYHFDRNIIFIPPRRRQLCTEALWFQVVRPPVSFSWTPLLRNAFRFGTHVRYDSRLSWLDFGGQRSEVNAAVTSQNTFIAITHKVIQ